jgi:ribosomal protein S12 methylthiotransferase accessory factor
MELTMTLGPGTRVSTQVKGHEIRTDQPRDDGGEDSAPSPFALFLASLGTCAGFYVLSFCAARGISTEGIAVTQRAEWDRATHRLATIGIEIRLPPSFPDKYRDAVRRAAESCAVKKVLQDPPELVVTTTAQAAP